MKLNKILALILALVMVLSLAACGNDAPVVDEPDAPAVELSLTVPSWTSSIGRAYKNINAAIVSDRAKKNLKEVLCDLQGNIAELLALIEEE